MNSLGGTGGMLQANRTGTLASGKTPKFSGDKIPRGYKAGAIQQYTPEQLQLLQQSIGNVGPDSYLSRLAGGDQDLFNEMEEPALRQFNQLAGGLASRFSGGGGGQGAMSSRRSSGFQNAGSAAASDFASQLRSQRQNLQRQAIMDLQGISSQLLDKRPFERTITEKPKKWWEEPLAGFANSAAQSLGSSMFGGGSSGGGAQQFAAMMGG